MIGLAMMLAAAEPGPYHLVVSYQGGGGTVVIDYPTQARCERALAVLEADIAKRIQQMRENVTPGATVIGMPYRYIGVCIPG